MDVRLVERLGVRLVFDTTIGIDIPFEDLQRDYDAIAITAGAMNPVYLDVPGADLDGVKYGIDFMKLANLGQELTVGRNVVVIGGGYTAMDCSRTSLRYGAENVTIAYRRTRSELVVDEEELGETEREGVQPRVPRQPDGAAGRGRQAHRRALHPQQAGRAGRLGPPLAGPHPGLGVRRPRGHGHPGRLAGGGPLVPARRGRVRGRPRPPQGGPGDVRDQRARRLRLRRLRDRPHHPDRVRRPRQEGRLRHRPLPRRPDGRHRHART